MVLPFPKLAYRFFEKSSYATIINCSHLQYKVRFYVLLFLFFYPKIFVCHDGLSELLEGKFEVENLVWVSFPTIYSLLNGVIFMMIGNRSTPLEGILKTNLKLSKIKIFMIIIFLIFIALFCFGAQWTFHGMVLAEIRGKPLYFKIMYVLDALSIEIAYFWIFSYFILFCFICIQIKEGYDQIQISCSYNQHSNVICGQQIGRCFLLGDLITDLNEVYATPLMISMIQSVLLVLYLLKNEGFQYGPESPLYYPYQVFFFSMAVFELAKFTIFAGLAGMVNVEGQNTTNLLLETINAKATSSLEISMSEKVKASPISQNFPRYEGNLRLRAITLQHFIRSSKLTFGHIYELDYNFVLSTIGFSLSYLVLFTQLEQAKPPDSVLNVTTTISPAM